MLSPESIRPAQTEKRQVVPDNHLACAKVNQWESCHGKQLLLTHITVHTILVCMKNITLSAREEAIERGRQVAINRNTTLNELFRDWLEQLGEGALRQQSYRQQMEQLKGRVRVGRRKFTREEMNER